MSKNEVKKIEQEANSLMVPEANEAWGCEEMSSADIRIPRILLMQPLSVAVSEDKAQPGDMINSLDQKVLCGKKDTMAIVPIYFFKNWQIMEELNGKFEFKCVEPYTASNANRPREEILNGVKVQNNLGYNMLCMLEKDLSDPTSFPYVLTFRRMNSNCGKDLVGYGQKAALGNKPPCIYTIELGSEIKKNDKGSFYVNKITNARATKDFAQYAPILHKWYETFKAGNNVLVDSEIEPAEPISDEQFRGQF